MGKASRLKAVRAAAPINLDFGCGPHKREGYHGVDQFPFVGVDTVLDVRTAKWPWKDASVGAAHASHFIEHLTGLERVHFFNELYRVLVPGGQVTIITPHWASTRAYGDFTHAWPPVSEFLWFYLLKGWRMREAPHTDASVNPAGYTCDFDVTYHYSMHPQLVTRNDEYKQTALLFYKEAAQDMHATLTKRPADTVPPA